MRYFSTALAAFLCLISKSFSDNHNKLCMTAFDCSYPMWECFRDVHGSFGYCRKRKQVSRSSNRNIRAIHSDPELSQNDRFPVALSRSQSGGFQAALQDRRLMFQANRKDRTSLNLRKKTQRIQRKGKQQNEQSLSHSKSFQGDLKKNRVLEDQFWWKSREGRRKAKEKQRIQIRGLNKRKNKNFSQKYSKPQDFLWWQTRSGRRKRFKDRISKREPDPMSDFDEKLKLAYLLFKDPKKRNNFLKRSERSASLWSKKGTFDVGLVPVEIMERQNLKDFSKPNKLKSDDIKIIHSYNKRMRALKLKSSLNGVSENQELERRDKKQVLARSKRQKYFAPGSVMFLNGKFHFVKQKRIATEIPKEYPKEFPDIPENNEIPGTNVITSTDGPFGIEPNADLDKTDEFTDEFTEPEQLNKQLKNINQVVRGKGSKKTSKDLPDGYRDDLNSDIENEDIEDHVKSFDKKILNEENSLLNSYAEETNENTENNDDFLLNEHQKSNMHTSSPYEDMDYESMEKKKLRNEENLFRNRDQDKTRSHRNPRMKNRSDQSAILDSALNSERLRRKVHYREDVKNAQETHNEKVNSNTHESYSSTDTPSQPEKIPKTMGVSYRGIQKFHPEVYPGWIPPYPLHHFQFGYQPPVTLPPAPPPFPEFNNFGSNMLIPSNSQIDKRYSLDFNFPRKKWASNKIQGSNSIRDTKQWDSLANNRHKQKFVEFGLPFGGSVLGTKIKKNNSPVFSTISKNILIPLQSDNKRRLTSQSKNDLGSEDLETYRSRTPSALYENSPSISSSKRSPYISWPLNTLDKMFLKTNEDMKLKFKKSPQINSYLLESKFPPFYKKGEYFVKEPIEIDFSDTRRNYALNIPTDNQYFVIAPTVKKRQKADFFKKQLLQRRKIQNPQLLSNNKNEIFENPIQSQISLNRRNPQYARNKRLLWLINSPKGRFEFQNLNMKQARIKKHIPGMLRSNRYLKRYFKNPDQKKSHYWYPTPKTNYQFRKARQLDLSQVAEREAMFFSPKNPYLNFDSEDCKLNRFQRRGKNCKSRKILKKLRKFLKCKTRPYNGMQPLQYSSKGCTEPSDLLQPDYTINKRPQLQQNEIPPPPTPFKLNMQPFQQYPKPTLQQLLPMQAHQPDFQRQSVMERVPQAQIPQFRQMQVPQQKIFEIEMQPSLQQPYPIQQQPVQQQSYPVPQQPYPVQQQPYPVQQQPYQIQQQSYPVQQQPNPVQQQPYPVQQQSNPVQQQPYPVQQQPYPVQQQLYSPQQQPFPLPFDQMSSEINKSPQQQIVKIDPYIMTVQKPRPESDNLKIQLQWDSSERNMGHLNEMPSQPMAYKFIQPSLKNMKRTSVQSSVELSKPEFEKVLKKSVETSSTTGQNLISELEELKKKINRREKTSDTIEKEEYEELHSLISNDVNNPRNQDSLLKKN